MIKKFLLLLLFVSTFSYGDIESWLESKVNKFIGLDPNTIQITNLEYRSTPSPIRSSLFFVDVSARIKNLSKEDTVKYIVFIYEILECNSSGKNCTTIGEEEVRGSKEIPPGQMRYYENRFGYTNGNSDKSIFFRQTVKYVYQYYP